MSEFGNETATAVLKFSTKAMEEFFKLLKFIFERNERKLNKEIKKAQLEESKQKQSQLKREEKLEKRREWLSKKKGLINYKDLLKGGDALYPVGYQCSQKEIDRLSKLAKIEGVPFAILKNSVVLNRINEIEQELKTLKKEGISEENQAKYNELQQELKELENRREEATIMVRGCDLERFKNLTDRLNKEIRLSDIDEKAKQYEAKGEENLSEEELKAYEEIKKERNEILRDEFDSFNENNNDAIVASAEGKSFGEEMSFDMALARVTDREYATKPCYICERTNPDNYMQVISQKEISDEGKPFVNTEYKVFNQGQQQRSEEFSHGKFTHYTDSKGESTSSYGQKHWDNMKKEIKEKGGFSDDVLIFASKERYEEYKQRFAKTQEQVKPREDTIGAEFDANSYKDYAGVVNKLKSQLNEHKLSVNASNEVCKENGDVLKVTAYMTDDEKLEAAEMINIGKQVSLYEKLNDNQMKSAFASNQMEMNEENFTRQGRPEEMRGMYEQMRDNLHSQIYQCSQQEAVLKSQINQLQNERLQLSSVKIVDLVQDDSIEHEDTLQSQNRQHDSHDINFQQEMENEKEDEFTHGEEKGQSKAEYERQIDRNQDIQSSRGMNREMEVSTEITEERS